MTKILIITTAITRPEIHSKSLPTIKPLITKEDNITWIVNIDLIHNTDTLENTQNNIINLFKEYDNITFEFILNNTGSLNQAVRNVANKAKKYIEKTDIVFYLEDDWVASKSSETISSVIKSYDLSKMFIINLTGYKKGIKRKRGRLRKRILFNLQPQLWSKEMFHKKYINFFDWIKYKGHDPEKLLYECHSVKWIKNINHVFFDTNNILFKDIGRNWLNKNGLIKWNKQQRGSSTYTIKEINNNIEINAENDDNKEQT